MTELRSRATAAAERHKLHPLHLVDVKDKEVPALIDNEGGLVDPNARVQRNHETLLNWLGARVKSQDKLDTHEERDTQDLYIYGRVLEDRTEIRLREQEPSQGCIIVHPALPEPYDQVDFRSGLLLQLLDASDLKEFVNKYVTGCKPWPGSQAEKDSTWNYSESWDAYLQDKLPLLIRHLATKSRQCRLITEAEAKMKKLGIGAEMDAAKDTGVLPTQAPSTACPECGLHLAAMKKQKCPACLKEVTPVCKTGEARHCVKTPLGYMVQDPATKQWAVQNLQDPKDDYTDVIYDDYAVDLGDCAQAPDTAMTEDDQHELERVFKCIAEQGKLPDELRKNIEALSARDPESMARPRIEAIIKRLHSTNTIRIVTALEEGEVPDEGKVLSFNPSCMTAMQALKVKQQDEKSDKSWEITTETSVDLEADSDVEELLKQGQGGPGSEAVIDADGSRSSKAPGPEPAKKKQKKSSHLHALAKLQEAINNPSAEGMGIMPAASGLADDMATNPALKDLDITDALKTHTGRRDKDTADKERWDQYQIDLERLFDGEDKSIWGTHRRYVELGISKTARITNLGATAQTVKDQIQKANGLAIKTRLLLKDCSRQNWKKMFTTPYPLDAIRLWKDAPPIKGTGKPPETDDERRMTLLALNRKFSRQLRQLYSEWYRVTGPAPKVDEPLPKNMLSIDMRRPGYSMNYWGSLLMQKANAGEDGALDEKLGKDYIYGNRAAARLRQETEGDAGAQAVVDAEGDLAEIPEDLEPRKDPDRDVLPPNFAKLLTPILAESTQPEAYHWERRVATFSWDHLVAENMQNCTLTQLLRAWQALPLLHEGHIRGTAHAIHAKREQREKEIREHAAQIKDFFDLKGTVNVKDQGTLRVVLSQVVKSIKELTFAPPELVGRIWDVPLAPTCDSKQHMRMRCEYDERLSFPLDALLEFQMQDGLTVGQYLGMKSGTKQRAAAFRFYRCPFDFYVTKGGVTLGPFPCGAVLSARSDWHHVYKAGGKRRNVWQCKNCTGDWSKGRTGTRMLQIITKDWLMNIILDETPQDLETRWQNERMAYYSRLEPHAAPRDVKPYFHPTKVAKRLRLTGRYSDAMWAMVMENHELQEYTEIERLATMAIAKTKDQKEDPAPEESTRAMIENLRLDAVARAEASNTRLEVPCLWAELSKD